MKRTSKDLDDDFSFADFLETFTHIVLYERDVYDRSVFRKELLFGSIIPICQVEQVKDYITSYTTMIKQHLLNRKSGISYRISLKCHDQIIERFVIHLFKKPISTSIRKSTPKSDFFAKLFESVRQIDAKPVDDCCDKSSRTFSIECRFEENFEKTGLKLKINPQDSITDFKIIPITSMNNTNEEIECYIESRD
uniref:Uncharacterized protein n=1 Tax=Romanomermis culicivorax TaxID=13658 RepID=A0A915JS83_ROMCU